MSLRVRCFAKINTILRVLSRRPDGYHELDTELVGLALHDRLDMEGSAGGFELEVIGAPISQVPVAGNLVLQAAHRLQDALGADRVPGALMRLDKRIPAAAGLGGGSSDAAATLEGLCRLFGQAPPEGLLAELALELGSDVPYFLVGGRCRGRGRGELLEPLEDRLDRPVALLVSRRRLSTADVFREHSSGVDAEGEVEGGALTRRKIGSSLETEPWWATTELLLGNDLRAAALKLSPPLAEVEERLRALMPAAQVGLTGSGPTIFALLRPGEATDGIEAARRRLERGDADLILTRTLGRREWHRDRYGVPPGAPRGRG